MEVGNGWFLHVKRETKPPSPAKSQTHPPPPLHFPAKSCCTPADFSSAQSPRLMVTINCEARWLFADPDARSSAASLWAAHPSCSPSPHKQSHPGASPCPCPWAPRVPARGPGAGQQPGQAGRRPDAYFHMRLTNGLSGTTLLFSPNGVLFSLSSSLAHKRHIITGGERGGEEKKRQKLCKLQQSESLNH